MYYHWGVVVPFVALKNKKNIIIKAKNAVIEAVPREPGVPTHFVFLFIA